MEPTGLEIDGLLLASIGAEPALSHRIGADSTRAAEGLDAARQGAQLRRSGPGGLDRGAGLETWLTRAATLGLGKCPTVPHAGRRNARCFRVQLLRMQACDLR